jgi:hypothetical protein
VFCLGFCTAAATEAKDLNHWLRQIKAVRRVPGQPFEIDKLTFDVLHRFAAGADQVVMGFEIAVHTQRGRMRSDLSQQSTLDEKPQIVVDRGKRNGWNAAPDRGVNVFGGIVPVGSDDGLKDHLTLVRDRQPVLGGQLTELFMAEAHDYRMRMIIKQPGAVSNDISPLTSKTAVGPKTRLWLSYHDRHRDLLLDGFVSTPETIRKRASGKSATTVPLNPGNSLKRYIRPVAKELNIELGGWHDFRHTIATSMLRPGTA